MELPEQYVEEIHETFKEDEILEEGVIEDKSTKKEPDFLDAGSNSPPMAKSESSEELTTQQGTTDIKSYLDSIFGELPPKSLIKTNLLFPKPARPKTLYKTWARHRPLSTNERTFLGDEIEDQEAKARVLENTLKSQSARNHSVHVDGMLLPPAPAPSLLFSREET